MAGKQVRLSDKGAVEMLKILCKTDFRTETGMIAFLIRKEYKQRFGLNQVPEPLESVQLSERG